MTTMPRKASRASRSRGRKSERSTSPKNLADLRDLLGPPPLWPGEDEVAYRQLAQRIRDYVAPKDVIDEILIADYTELSWEVWRRRQRKAKCIPGEACNELASVLQLAGHHPGTHPPSPVSGVKAFPLRSRRSAERLLKWGSTTEPSPQKP